jgi:hypothetical protein
VPERKGPRCGHRVVACLFTHRGYYGEAVLAAQKEMSICSMTPWTRLDVRRTLADPGVTPGVDSRWITPLCIALRASSAAMRFCSALNLALRPRRRPSALALQRRPRATASCTASATPVVACSDEITPEPDFSRFRRGDRLWEWEDAQEASTSASGGVARGRDRCRGQCFSIPTASR